MMIIYDDDHDDDEDDVDHPDQRLPQGADDYDDDDDHYDGEDDVDHLDWQLPKVDLDVGILFLDCFGLFVFSCPGSSIPDLGQWVAARFEF